MFRSLRASSLISSRSEYRFGVLLWQNSRSSLESLGRRAAFSWACWCASSARRTTSWTSWQRPWERGCWGSVLWYGLLLMTSRFIRSAWQCVEWTEIRTWGEKTKQMSVRSVKYHAGVTIQASIYHFLCLSLFPLGYTLTNHNIKTSCLILKLQTTQTSLHSPCASVNTFWSVLTTAYQEQPTTPAALKML